MIIDSSAIVAITLKGDGYESLQERIARASEVKVGSFYRDRDGHRSGGSLGVAGKTLLARFLREEKIEVIPTTQEHWWTAVDAYERFGRRRHPAGLNFGDCLTYATASVAGESLSYGGDGFSEIDRCWWRELSRESFGRP